MKILLSFLLALVLVGCVEVNVSPDFDAPVNSIEKLLADKTAEKQIELAKEVLKDFGGNDVNKSDAAKNVLRDTYLYAMFAGEKMQKNKPFLKVIFESKDPSLRAIILKMRGDMDKKKTDEFNECFDSTEKCVLEEAK